MRNLNGMKKVLVHVVALSAVGMALAAPMGLPKTHIPKNRDWKIVYGTTEGCEGRALEFLSTEIGAHIQRDPDTYTLHVVACEKAGAEREAKRNAVVTGTLRSNALLAKHLKPSDVPEGGYVVKVVEAEGRQLVLCCGDTPAASIWAAVDFIDDGLASMRVDRGDGAFYEDEIFERPKLPVYESRRSPRTARRSVFTWAHVINDYRSYFRNLARLKINEVILWNDYPPVNAKEIVDFAHSWGVSVLWGWSWGWGVDCSKIDFDGLKATEERIVRNWREKWRPCCGDGIYFQSFTEIRFDTVGEHSVPEAVLQIVNGAARRILADDPALRIVFGLHAWSMKKHLATFSKVDPRLEILWENCGGFPFNAEDEEPEVKTEATCRAMLAMPGRKTGFAYKWQLIQDWSRFAPQSGSYVLGRNAESVKALDRRVQGPLWTKMTREWLSEGDRALRLTRMIQRDPNAGSLNVVVNLNEPVRLPTALCAELFWSSDEEWKTVLRRVLNRAWLMNGGGVQ